MIGPTLYHCPGACSQVAVCAFEKAGLPYELQLIDVGSGQQNSADYARVTEMQKIPALQMGNALIIENAAIITLIAELAPDAGLFPDGSTPLAVSRRIEGLSYCGATLHPIVRGIFAPNRFTDGDDAPVRSRALALASKSFAFAEHRMAANGGWWLGDWSIIDVYLNWTIATAERGGYDFSYFPSLFSLRTRLLSQSCFIRMQELEIAWEATLAERRSERNTDASY